MPRRKTSGVYTRQGKVLEGTCQLCNASVHVNGDYSSAKRCFDTVEVVLDAKADSRGGDDSPGGPGG